MFSLLSLITYIEDYIHILKHTDEWNIPHTPLPSAMGLPTVLPKTNTVHDQFLQHCETL